MIFEGHEYKNVLCIDHEKSLEVNDFIDFDGTHINYRKVETADIVFAFKNGEINIIKNRYGANKTIYFENEEEYAKFLLLL